MIVNLPFLASRFRASVTDGIFKREGAWCYARATDIMSTQSATAFEWSIKFMGFNTYAGIASKFKPEEKFIYQYDPTAISFHDSPGQIRLGSRLRNRHHHRILRTQYTPKKLFRVHF